MVDVPTDVDPLKAYNKEMAKAKRLILDGVRVKIPTVEGTHTAANLNLLHRIDF